MKILGADQSVMWGSRMSLQHSLRPDLTMAAMLEQLAAMAPRGMEPVDFGPSRDGKSQHQTAFYADDWTLPCGVWDYRGARWSAFGPREVFERLGWLASEQ